MVDQISNYFRFFVIHIKKVFHKKPVKKQVFYDRNEWIKAPSVRVINDDGSNLGVMATGNALAIAKEKELDLVLISPNEEVPVARIVDWSKFKYTMSKKHKASPSGIVKSKEWWFSPVIEENDIRVKLNQIIKFLKKGGRVKITVRYQKRISSDIMQSVLEKILEIGVDSLELQGEIKKEGLNLCAYVKLKS